MKKILIIIFIVLICFLVNSKELNKKDYIDIAREYLIQHYPDKFNPVEYKSNIYTSKTLSNGYKITFKKYIFNYISGRNYLLEISYDGSVKKFLDNLHKKDNSISDLFYKPALNLSKKQAEEKVKYVYEKIARTKNFTILNDEEFKIEYPKYESYKSYHILIYNLANYNTPIWYSRSYIYPVNASLNGWNWDNVNWKNVMGESSHEFLPRLCWMVGTAIKNENSYSWLTIFYVDVETGEIIYGNGYLSNILSVLMENYEPKNE